MNLKFKKPITGKYLDISKADDDVFSQNLLGPGFVVNPDDKNIYSPIHGKIKMIYPTHHAIAISTDDLDILIHVGLSDKLRHQHLFELHVNLNDIVSQGDKLLSFNFDYSSFDEVDYQIPIVFVQKKSLQIRNETKDAFELIIL